MVTYDVAGLNNCADDLWTLLDVAADQKKSCVHAVFGKNIEQSQSVRVVGAVVVSQCELARGARESGESLAIPLTCRRHGLVTGGDDGRGANRASQGEGEHVGIVNASEKVEFRMQK